MRLLNQRENNENFQKQQAKEFRDGEAMAKEVDKVRIALLNEQDKYRKGIILLQTKFKEFQAITDEQIKILSSEVKELERRKAKALEPLTAYEKELAEREDAINQKQEFLTTELDKTKQKQIEFLTATSEAKTQKQQLDSETKLWVQKNKELLRSRKDLDAEWGQLSERETKFQTFKEESERHIDSARIELTTTLASAQATYKINQNRDKELKIKEKKLELREAALKKNFELAKQKGII